MIYLYNLNDFVPHLHIIPSSPCDM